MGVADDTFGDIDYIGNGSCFIFNWGFLFVGVYKVNVVGQEGETAPEEEAVDPPTDSVPILFFFSRLLRCNSGSYSSN